LGGGLVYSCAPPPKKTANFALVFFHICKTILDSDPDFTIENFKFNFWTQPNL